ncbi:pentatricopeptide repeat-containing protein At3g09650, chloroplastic [Cryptomeria japonica]|uniref:pentatricopeptide repeat-containing protein At3g09650, chloroplastic n=1 Tax=Cryptomeria japonica TaxID=3369 RepID=UPI0027D9F1C3|nr:pentatricopeptide repeat-containing protein At3g09650, chloroplastic [Cryptomeria japonica]
MEFPYHCCPCSVSFKAGGQLLFSPIFTNFKSTRWKQQNYYNSKQVRVKCEGSVEVAGNSIVVKEKKEDAMLVALKERRTEDAWKILEQLGELPSSKCLSRLVAQLSYQGSAFAFRRAQTVVKRLQNEEKLHLLDCNSLGLLAMAAAKSGVPQYGATVIRLMLKSGLLPHVKAWSAVISRLGKCPHDFESAIDLFYEICKRIRETNGVFNDEVPVNVRPDTGAFNAILNACATGGNMERAHMLIGEMGLFGMKPDVLTYNIMIKMYARAERKDLLVGVMEKILRENIEPCSTTFHSLVAAYVGFGDLEMAERLVQAMREGRRDICSVMREPNVKIGRSGSLEMGTEKELDVDCHEDASDANLLLPRSYKPDAEIYTILMKGYMQWGRLEDVVQMLRAMQTEDDSQSHPDEVTYTTAISAFVRMGLMDEARKVLQEMASDKVPANIITYNVLLNGYCKLLDIQKAEILLQDMKEAGIAPDVVTYNTLINGCIRIDDNVGALSYFNQMREAGIPPSNISYTTLVKAFAMNGQPKFAAKVFDEMQKNPRVKLDIVAWNMLIESYCRAGWIEDAKKAFVQMKEHKLHPNVATYGSLINGFAKAGKPGEALVLWREIKERTMSKGGEGGIKPLEPDVLLLDSLVDICVRAAFFKRALEVIACMEYLRIPANKTKYKRMFVELHSRLYTSKHASQARQARRAEQKRALEAFKFWVGLPNNYYESEWKTESDG